MNREPLVRFFYRDEYVSRVLEAGFRHTFDVEKPRRIYETLIASDAASESAFLAVPMVNEEQLRLVHTEDYLTEIRRPETLARLLFLDPSHPWDEQLIEPFLYASGGTVAAAEAAVRSGGIGANLSGGYHHAQPDKAEGFCAIADVAIAIRQLQAARAVERVLIVDLDYHHGNGNALIFAADESVFTFSVHAGNWCWITKRHNLDVELPSRTADDAYLAVLEEHLPRLLRDFAPELVMYVAGSDPFIEDLLGDFDITEAGMLRRDQYVTDTVRARGVPMAIVTAGGYGPASWRVHFNYYRWLCEGGV